MEKQSENHANENAIKLKDNSNLTGKVFYDIAQRIDGVRDSLTVAQGNLATVQSKATEVENESNYVLNGLIELYSVFK